MSNKLLVINLTNETLSEVILEQDIYKKFIGGKGLGAYLLFKYLKKGTNALAPENLLLFLTGPLTGSSFPTSGRMVIVSKSPLTGTYTDSHVGGHLGPEIRKAGYAGIIITGKSATKKYLWIKDEKIEFRNCEHIWGSRVSDTVELLRQGTDSKARVACIGPAGENISLISSIMIDKDGDKKRAGIAGRTGLGAVMGSKNLKAIVIRGSSSLEYENGTLMNSSSKETLRVIKSNDFMKVRRNYGSANLIGPMNQSGFLPTHNFQDGFIRNGEDLYCESMNRYKNRNSTCFNCPIACGQVVKTKDESEVKVEYESIALLGSNNGVTDFLNVADACLLCNELGIDTMSAGVVIGFAMECKEKGLIDDGPKFGNTEQQLKLLEDLAYKRNLGKIFSDGVKRASDKIGQNSYKFAIHVKGLEMAGYEPRTSWGMALSYATADRGACHQRCWTVNTERAGGLTMFSFEDKPSFVVDVQNERAAAFSMLICDFLPFNKGDIVTAWEAVTGIPLTEEEYLKAGERIWNLIKLFNIREGFGRKDDTLPPRMFEENLKLPKGVYDRDEVVIPRDEFEHALDLYYEERGWNSQGIPTSKKIKELDLEEFGVVV